MIKIHKPIPAKIRTRQKNLDNSSFPTVQQITRKENQI